VEAISPEVLAIVESQASIESANARERRNYCARCWHQDGELVRLRLVAVGENRKAQSAIRSDFPVQFSTFFFSQAVPGKRVATITRGKINNPVRNRLGFQRQPFALNSGACCFRFDIFDPSW